MRWLWLASLALVAYNHTAAADNYTTIRRYDSSGNLAGRAIVHTAPGSRSTETEFQNKDGNATGYAKQQEPGGPTIYYNKDRNRVGSSK